MTTLQDKQSINHLLVGLLIDLYDGDSLLDLAENHVEVLVVGVQPALQLPLVPHLHVYPLVQRQPGYLQIPPNVKTKGRHCLFTQPDEIERFLNCSHWRCFDLISHSSLINSERPDFIGNIPRILLQHSSACAWGKHLHSSVFNLPIDAF